MPAAKEIIFVFGSNLAGKHGAGAAYTARTKYGALAGIGVGAVNRSYAIPTKDCNIETLPRPIVAMYIAQFCRYAQLHWLYQTPYAFMVTRVGCGLAGFQDREIAPFFTDCPPNCTFDKAWYSTMGQLHQYWGTFP